MRSDVHAIPEGLHTITPHIAVREPLPVYDEIARAAAAAFG